MFFSREPFIVEMIVQLLAVLGAIFGFIAVTLAVAAGLYYFSELIEENASLARKTLTLTTKVVAALLVLLWLVDGFPLTLTLVTLATTGVHHLSARRFPKVELQDPLFLLSCALAVLNHYLWYQHFAHPYVPTIEQRLDYSYQMPYYPTFGEVAAFFGICIWLIPFALFISISSNETGTLPMSSTDLGSAGSADRDHPVVVKKGVNALRAAIVKLGNGVSEFLKLLGVNFKFGGKSDGRNPNELYI